VIRRFLIFPLKVFAFTAGVLLAAWGLYVDWSHPSWTSKQVLIYMVTGVSP